MTEKAPEEKITAVAEHLQRPINLGARHEIEEQYRYTDRTSPMHTPCIH
ncbi:hypothetical protein [Pseudoxanthomonas sp. Root630]|nr:hypothetical protein [Pseudoxanthomonas sp. Root630]